MTTLPTSVEQSLYIPPGCVSLNQLSIEPQIRLGIQGYPNTGKTWSAMSFPNPIVTNMDRKLGAHVGRSDIVEVPFYNPSFVDKIIPRSGSSAPPNRRDALLIWLSKEGIKLSPNQTLVLDGNTQIQNAFLAEYKLNPRITKNGKIDDFGEYRVKIDYFNEIMELLKMLKCHVIYICHETAARDSEGDLNGKVRPLMSGQFGDQLAGNFTDWFRQHAVPKPQNEERYSKFKEKFKLTDTEAKEWIASTDKDHNTIYCWQTYSDDICNCGTQLVNVPQMILARYESYAKYKRQTNKQTT